MPLRFKSSLRLGSSLLCLVVLCPAFAVRCDALPFSCDVSRCNAFLAVAFAWHDHALPLPCIASPLCRCSVLLCPAGLCPRYALRIHSVATLIVFALSRICRPYLAAVIAFPITRRCMSLTFSVFLLASVISCFLPSAVTTPVLIGTQQHACPCSYHADSQQRQHDSRAAKQVNPAILGHTAGYQRSEKAHSCKPSVAFVGHWFQSPFAVSCNPRT